MDAICTERVPPLADAAPWVPAALAAVVHKGLAREPDDRWQSMDALLAALAPHTGGTEDFRNAAKAFFDKKTPSFEGY